MNQKLETTDSKRRVLPFKGVLNFRDMGGYTTSDGRKVKYGLFFRSAELTGMTDHDIKLFKSLGIKTIFDYRGIEEVRLKPDPVIPGVNNICVPALKQEVPGDMRDVVRSGFLEHFTTDFLVNMYLDMAFNNPSFKRLMATIMLPEAFSILHHCAGGRDRTGVGSAFIFLALGVPRETIIEDYLLSNQTLGPMNEQIKKQASQHLSPTEVDTVMAALILRREFMEAIFSAIDERYKSVDAFLEQEFGMTADKRKQLQAYCLEA
ncbi:tyrosine-protein phosphatase [Paenibacillus sp. G2S3]|uniref:tyrosine-protein phosphatase n=1 Tax=Paenibacillus sp. G2S3 TaxID=3047872 RepID=UPI0024C0F2A4|nr:tyrosine-protein phosphatase [Paenibacillus sp. G2S3]WHY21779.1 tyrosine-protein phosphatase [Paenibacillus sp. G2S3]